MLYSRQLDRPTVRRMLGMPRWVATCELPHGFQFLAGGGQGGLDRGDLAQPALLFGLLEPVAQVGVDLLQPWHLGGVDPKEWASDAGLTCPVFITGREFLPDYASSEDAH
ncbi:MAG: hypothetical protein JWN52_5715 [Actinomycetia bacterium]|nr:hypothetical protein [Actinomycetes bacterium]